MTSLGFEVVSSNEVASASSLLHKGISFSELGDYENAAKAFSSARPLLLPEGNPATRFLVFNNLGRCQAALNRPVSAYHAYKTALLAVKETDNVEHLLGVTENLASLCVRIGKPEEALEYAMLASMICEATHRRESAENYNTRGVASFLLGQYEDAENAHRTALKRVDKTRSGLRMKIAENLAADLAAQEKHVEALSVFDEAVATASSEGTPVKWICLGLKIKRIYLQVLAGEELAAREALLKCKANLDATSLSEATQLLLLTIDAEFAKRDGEYVAEANLRMRMIEQIERQGDTTGDLLLFGANAWRYLDAADAWVRAGNPAEAMRWLEIGRRAEEQSLASRSVSLLDDAVLVSQIEECKNLGEVSRIAQARVDSIAENEGLKNTKESPAFSASEALAVAVQAEKAYEQAKEALRKANPDYWKALFSDRLNVHPDEMNQIANVLPSEVTFIEPVMFRNQVAVFLCSKGKPPICITAPLDEYGKESSVRGLVEKFHFMLSNRISESQLKKTSKKLYDILIAPVAEQIEQRKTSTLLVSPVGYLRYIPFASLFDGEEYLVENYAVANVTGLDLIRMASSSGTIEKKPTFVGFANPDGTLPGATEECRQIASLFAPTDIFQ